MRFLEIACFDLASVKIAAEAGADRIELCLDRSSGGLTPPMDWVKHCLEFLSIPMRVMIRSKSDNFFYAENEIEDMQQSILSMRDLPIDGFVLGCLNSNLMLDIDCCGKLISLGNGKPFTLHKAIDEVSDLLEGVEEAKKAGFQAILSSGGKKTAWEGRDRLRRMGEQAQESLQVMAGGGVRSENLPALVLETELLWYHSAGIINEKEGISKTEIQKMCSILHN